MAVEIKEIVIRAILTEEEQLGKATTTNNNVTKEDIVQDCVNQVLKILSKKNRR